MIELKPLRPEAFGEALKKAKRYRLLNEPDDAESICLDILAIQPDQQDALITLLLALTDKLRNAGVNPAFDQAQEIIPKLDSSYSKAYYRGVIFERRAKYHLKQGGPGSGTAAYPWFVKAMESYEEALTADDPKKQDAVMRWNSCARNLNNRPEVIAADSDDTDKLLDTIETPH